MGYETALAGADMSKNLCLTCEIVRPLRKNAAFATSAVLDLTTTARGSTIVWDVGTTGTF